MVDDKNSESHPSCWECNDWRRLAKRWANGQGRPIKRKLGAGAAIYFGNFDWIMHQRHRKWTSQPRQEWTGDDGPYESVEYLCWQRVVLFRLMERMPTTNRLVISFRYQNNGNSIISLITISVWSRCNNEENQPTVNYERCHRVHWLSYPNNIGLCDL